MQIDCGWLALGNGAAEANGPTSAGVLVIALPEPGRVLRDEAALSWEGGDGMVEIAARDLNAALTDLGTLVRRQLAPLDAGTRAKLLDFLASTSSLAPSVELRELSESLVEVRAALRERRPALVPNGRWEAHVDRLMAVDERSFLIEGWIHDEAGSIARITAISPEGRRVALGERILRYPRPDVAEFLSSVENHLHEASGFICFFELDAPSVASSGWILEIEAEDGAELELAVPEVVIDPLETRDAILQGPYIEEIRNGVFMSDHVFPIVSKIQRRLRGQAKVESSVQLGTPPKSPEVSIVVPLEQQIGSLEVQLSQLADDPELADADLIYVLDSPDAVDALDRAADVFPIYRLPFRIALPGQAVDFAGAANAGAEIARARLLLLMEPDVVPAGPGWLGEMRSFYDATPAIGALSPKLLYEDDSIHHAGLYFYQRPGSSRWTQAGYFKGMHRALPVANVARKVPVLSRACLMIDRALYEKRGGLPEIYVGEGYEASDLCLRLSAEGLESWYLPDVELYHPELPAAPAARPPYVERYDGWLHDHRWGERIARLVEA
jgi:hypothetical protein